MTDMIGNRFHPWWSRAITLAECSNLPDVVRAGDAASGDVPEPSRLDRWRKQRPFERPELLARRLAKDALAERSFDATVRARAIGTPPAWVTRIDAARRSPILPGAFVQPNAGTRDAIGLELARAFVEPLVVSALGRVFAYATQLRGSQPAAPFESARVTALFEPALWHQLVQRCFKVGVLELNVARVQGELAGETPEARYADFARRLRTTDLRDRILEEYPVLARSLVIASDFWEASVAEFLRHVTDDARDIESAFGLDGSLGVISELTVGAGDVHRQGRSVMIVGFSSGTRLVYKPRSLAADEHFERLIAWINERGQTPPLSAVRSLDRGSHGWVEFAAKADCGSPDGVNRFYERFGSYLALLHALEATDFHYENVIAAGEHPMLIDLEALFHPRHAAPSVGDDPDWIGWNVLQHSVLRAGVLPLRTFGNEKSAGIDLSAVGGGGAQQTPNRFPTLVDAGTDTMRLERDFVTLPASQNRPSLGGQVVDPTQYIDRILAGFSSTYRLLMRHRDELLGADGPIRRFADAPVRVVLRPTRHYALILSESYHPDVLRDALDRDLLLDRLWVAIPGRPELERVVSYEHADLVVGDVPLFTSRPDSRDLFSTHGDRIEDYFAQSGLDAALARIESLSESDLHRQEWVVRASLVALTPARHGTTQHAGQPAAKALPNANRRVAPSGDESIAAADGVAHRLGELALREGSRVTWLGLTLAMDRDWVIQPVGPDVYGGSLGIAFFLAHSAQVTGDSEHDEIARAVISQTVSRLRLLMTQGSPETLVGVGSLGAFGLLGGTVYALSHLGVLWNDPELLDVAERVADAVRGGIAADAVLDVIGGTAGLAMAVAALVRARPSEVARSVLRECAEQLMRTAVEQHSGIAWRTRIESTQPLTGFSHGASGIASALVTAASVLDEPRYATAARAAFAYERATFDASAGNWPDYRILDGTPVAAPLGMWSWCHGAPGIGLSRLIALGQSDDADARHDLHVALASTIANGFGANDSLCHGDLGNLDLLLRAKELGFTGSWEDALATEGTRLVERLGTGAWRCGIPGGVETPGLMMGLAGIGYGLLRLGATERVPSLLSLEAPRVALRPTGQP
ncbi:MAG TPA: type 2 lanthipeptide synthetase LanM family protein [Gemmatimonadaceae bacterium]|nr:type 2 lanthipeptide synthetase LanM family protein [Gemmatimonadaceae bacterium]